MATQCDGCGCNTGDVLAVMDGVSVIQCTYGCGRIYITIDIGNGITKQMTLVDVVFLQSENERLTAANKSLMAELREERGYISFDD